MHMNSRSNYQKLVFIVVKIFLILMLWLGFGLDSNVSRKK